MAILLCQLLLLFSETLLPAERPLRHSGDTSYYAHRLLAGSRHQEWAGREWAYPLYKHGLSVNFRGFEQKGLSWPSSFLASGLFQPQHAFQGNPVLVQQAATIYNMVGLRTLANASIFLN